GPEQADRRAVLPGEVERSPHRRFGQRRSIERNQDLVELHMPSPVAVPCSCDHPAYSATPVPGTGTNENTVLAGVGPNTNWGRKASVGHRRPAGWEPGVSCGSGTC